MAGTSVGGKNAGRQAGESRHTNLTRALCNPPDVTPAKAGVHASAGQGVCALTALSLAFERPV